MNFLYSKPLIKKFKNTFILSLKNKSRVPVFGTLLLLARSYLRRFAAHKSRFDYENYPYTDKKYARDMRYVLPNLSYKRDYSIEHYLFNIRGIEEKYAAFSHNKRGFSIDSLGMYLRDTFLKSYSEDEIDNGGYFGDVFKFQCLVPNDFLTPKEYRETKSSIELGIIEKKRGKRRRYVKTIYNKSYKWYKDSYNHLYGSYVLSANDKILAEKKRLFLAIPNFDKDNYYPRSMIEAIYFFSIFGAPSKKSKNRNLSHIYLFIYFSGFYLSSSSFLNVTYEFVYRNIAMNYALYLAALEIKREEEYVPEQKEQENNFIYKIRLFNFFVFRFIKKYTIDKLVAFYKMATYKIWYFFLVRYYKYLRAHRALSESIYFPIRYALSPKRFFTNRYSYMWSFISYRVEAWFITNYVLLREILDDNSIEVLVDSTESSDTADLMDEFISTRVIDKMRNLLIDFIIYPFILLMRPIVELLFLFPIFLVRDKLAAFLLSIYIIKNNLWCSLLSFGKSGRWWKIPLIFVKSFAKLLFGLLFIWIFVVFVDYTIFMPPEFIAQLIPLSIVRGEWLIIYNAIIVYIALYLFGSYSLKEFFILELGFGDYLAWVVSMILWSWRIDSRLALNNTFSDSWIAFNLTPFGEEVAVNRDITTASYVVETRVENKDFQLESKYHQKSMTWRYSLTAIALGDDSKIVKDFKQQSI